MKLVIASPKAWQGRAALDTPRHREVYHFPMNYPRLNELPEWFTVERARDYRVTINGRAGLLTGADLAAGAACSVPAGCRTVVVVEPIGPADSPRPVPAGGR